MNGTRPDWSAAVLLDRTIPDRRHRARLAAGSGVALLLTGLLVAIGAGIVVAAIVVLAIAVAATRRLARALRERRSRARARRERHGRRRRLRAELGRTREAASGARRRAAPLAASGVERLRRTAKRTLAETEKRSAATAAALQGASRRVRETAPVLQQAVASSLARRELGPSARIQSGPSLRREALRLNTAGSSYRREGDPLRAKEHHLAALELVRRSEDRVAEALTLNNLALAMAAGGDEDGAIACFEQAQVVARGLDAPQYEGLIAANLAIAYRRRGLDEQAIRFLHVALEKLPPESGEYHRVEEQLRRAS